MRIVHVAPTPFGRDGLYGGGERYPVELARALAAEVDCELVTFGPTPRVTEVDGLRVRVLRAVTHLQQGHPAHPVAPGLPAALRGADLVHTHHLRSTPTRIAAVTARVSRRPVVVTDHGMSGGDWAGMLPRLFHRFLTVSRHSAERLGAPHERTRVIYGGADPSRFYPDGERREGVLYVGRLTPHKGVDRLIRALPAGVRLTCAGSPAHTRRPAERGYPGLLRELAAGKSVTFPGAVPDSELPLLYRRAQVLVLPSVHRTVYGREVALPELLGLAVIEAMASGTPVVASRLGGLPEVVRDGETGFLVTPGDVAELHDRIATLLADPVLAARMGRAAREVALERFTWQACAHRCLEAYDELLGGRMTITAVLPTYNRLTALQANLDNILAMTGIEQVLVVDDGSSDGTREWLEAHRGDRLRPLRHPVNRGSPAARNTGVAAARSEWVVFVEDDCLFPADYAAVLQTAAEAYGAEIVGAPMVHLRPGEDVAAAVARVRSRVAGVNGLDGVAGFPETPIRTPLIPATALVRRRVFDDVQFDPGYAGNAYREETDFFLRAEGAGHRCLLTGDTYFWEPARYSGGQPRNLAAEWHTVRNNWRFLRRHGRRLAEQGHIHSPLREQLAFTARRVLRRF